MPSIPAGSRTTTPAVGTRPAGLGLACRARPARDAERGGVVKGLRVAVVGAGVGGLCLAQGLHRAGADVTVYERDAALDSRQQGCRLYVDARAGLALQRCLAPELFELFLATCGRPGGRLTVLSERLRVLHEVAVDPDSDPSAVASLSTSANRLTLREVLAAGLRRRTSLPRRRGRDGHPPQRDRFLAVPPPCGARLHDHSSDLRILVAPSGLSSLKERSLVKVAFAGFWRSWGVRDWRLLFPGSCHVRGERPGRSRTGRSLAAAGGAGGVLEVTGREPDDLAAGNGKPGRAGACLVVSGPSHVRVSSGAGSAAGCSHPFAGPGRGRDAWGGSASGCGGQAGSIKRAPAPPGRRGRQTGGLAPGRLPGSFHAAWPEDLDRQRICPSRRP